MLRVDHVTKRFGGLVALDDICLVLPDKGVFGMIGPNGAGKTTLFNVICGFLRPDKGSIEFGGKNITNLRPDEICKLGLGRTFQHPKVFETLNVIENVMVGAFFASFRKDETDVRERCLELLKKVNLQDKHGEPVLRLTLAERKRLELARALAGRPNLLLVDELMAGLNPAEVDRCIEIVKEIRNSGITVLMIEHVMRAIMTVSDYVFVLDRGSKIAEGRPEEVAADAKVIRAYLGSDIYA